jgi:hypothetical protein
MRLPISLGFGWQATEMTKELVLGLVFVEKSLVEGEWSLLASFFRVEGAFEETRGSVGRLRGTAE